MTLTPEQVIAASALFYGKRPDELSSPSRERRLTHARYVAIVLLMELCDHTTRSAPACLNRSNAVMIHIKRVRQHLEPALVRVRRLLRSAA